MAYPVCLLVQVEKYYISIFLGKDRVEILDACGYLESLKDDSIREFLEVHSCGKSLFVSPRFVPRKEARLSFTPAIIYLYLRFAINESLCAFLELFTADFVQNAKIIAKFSQLIKNSENVNDRTF